MDFEAGMVEKKYITPTQKDGTYKHTMKIDGTFIAFNVVPTPMQKAPMSRELPYMQNTMKIDEVRTYVYECFICKSEAHARKGCKNRSTDPSR